MNKRKFTAETTGTIIASDPFADETPYLTIAYAVNGTPYTIKEKVRVKTELIKIGFLPIGQRVTYLVEKTNIGEKVPILYDPQNPRKAHIKGNDGWRIS